jgi:hypothetical protein
VCSHSDYPVSFLIPDIYIFSFFVSLPRALAILAVI